MNDEERAIKEYPTCEAESRQYLSNLTIEYFQISLQKAFIKGIKYGEEKERNLINTELGQMTQTNQIKEQTK